MENKAKKICPRCNYSGGNDDLNCPYCGVKLISNCPACSAPIRVVFAKYCYACGASLGESVNTGTIKEQGGKR